MAEMLTLQLPGGERTCGGRGREEVKGGWRGGCAAAHATVAMAKVKMHPPRSWKDDLGYTIAQCSHRESEFGFWHPGTVAFNLLSFHLQGIQLINSLPDSVDACSHGRIATQKHTHINIHKIIRRKKVRSSIACGFDQRNTSSPSLLLPSEATKFCNDQRMTPLIRVETL